jgi:hypothetical protein
MEFLMLVYFLLTLGCGFAVLAERNRKEQAKLDLTNSSDALESPSRGRGPEAGAPA